MESVIDVSIDYSADARAFYDAGVRTVIRYYNSADGRASKRLSAVEMKRWHAAGIATAVVYQDRGGSGGHIEDFGAAKGKANAFRALELAGVLSQPKGSAIYAAVDHDFTGKADLDQIDAYFAAFGAAVRAAGYRVGGYGTGLVTGRLRSKGLIDLVWLMGAYGTSGTRDAKAAGRYDLLQAPQKRATIAGKPVDYDPNAARTADFGQWGPGAAATTPRTPPPLQTPIDRTVRRGDKGQDVSRYQRILNLRADGDFGELTEAAVLGFQLGTGLAADGVIGPATRAALIAKEAAR